VLVRRIAFIEFLSDVAKDRLVSSRTSCEFASYGEQHELARRAFEDDRGSTAPGLRAAGWIASELFVNDESAQRAWARETGVVQHGLAVAIEQVRRLSPDVLFVGDVHAAPRVFLAAVRADVGVLVGRLDDEAERSFPWASYDLVLTKRDGVIDASGGARVARDPFAMGHLGDATPLSASSSSDFAERSRTIALRGSDTRALAASSDVRAALERAFATVLGTPLAQGEAGLRSRLEVMADTKVVVVAHDASYGARTGNLALLEAASAGALVLVDERVDIDDVLSIGEEVVTYRSPEECVGLVRHYLAHPDRAASIAKAGRQRCLRERGSAAQGAMLSAIFERALEDHVRSRRASRPRAIDAAIPVRRAASGAEGA